MKLLRCLFLTATTAALCVPSLSFASEKEYLEPYIVTGSHFEQAQNQIGSDVTVITAEEIQKYQFDDVSEALATVPGVNVVKTGTGITSLFVRGSKSNSMLVMIDGIAINDPSSSSIDISRISLTNVDRIEVVLGAQSAIYGANALSGVVNIITKKGDGETRGLFSAKIGLPENYSLQANLSGSTDTLAWSLGAGGIYANQLSSASHKFGKNEKDDTRNGDLSASLAYTPSDIFSISSTLRIDGQKTAYDVGSLYYYDPSLNATISVTNPDSEAEYHSNRILTSLAPSLTLFDGLWNQTLSLSYVFMQNQALESGFTSDRTYQGQTFIADWKHKIDLDWQQFAFGVLYQYEQMDSKYYNNIGTWFAPNYIHTKGNADQENVALYAEYTVNPFENFYATAAWRMDNYSNFKEEHSASISLAYTIEATGTFLHASAGKGYRAPTLFDLYGPWGNKTLEAESSRSWDIGFSQPLFDNKVEVFATYYQMTYDDMIEWLPSLNLSTNTSSHAKGIEVGVNLYPTEDLSIAAWASFEDNEIDNTDLSRIRQPKNKFRLDIDYRLPLETSINYYLGASVQYISETYDDVYDSSFNAQRIKLDDYTLVDLRFKAEVNENLSFTANINNIFDEEYEVVYGYETLGFNGSIGVEYKF